VAHDYREELSGVYTGLSSGSRGAGRYLRLVLGLFQADVRAVAKTVVGGELVYDAGRHMVSARAGGTLRLMQNASLVKFNMQVRRASQIAVAQLSFRRVVKGTGRTRNPVRVAIIDTLAVLDLHVGDELLKA